MINESTVNISKRFFEALHALIQRGDLAGKQTFTNQYGIDRWNMNRVEKDPEKLSVQMTWIAHLVKDYGVSARWVLTGQGKMFSKE